MMITYKLRKKWVFRITTALMILSYVVLIDKQLVLFSYHRDKVDSVGFSNSTKRRSEYQTAFPSEYSSYKYIDDFIDWSKPIKPKPHYNEWDDLLQKVNLDIPVPENINIVLSGDSLTRYQYIDFVYFLTYGRWIDPSVKPRLVWSKDFSDWNDFLNYTNRLLQPYEECDCYRDRYRNKYILLENRYFLDKERNNSVVFLQKFGDMDYNFSWNTSDVHNRHEMARNGPEAWANIKIRGSWVKMIKEYICMLTPKPSVFIFNAGFHGHSSLLDVKIQNEIINALHECNIKSMYKVTTKMSPAVKTNQMEAYEHQLCLKSDYCMDTTWTAFVPFDLYTDDHHFESPVYNLLNLQMLSILASNKD